MLILLLLAVITSLAAADMRDYEAGWAGEITAPSPFNYKVTLEQFGDSASAMTITNGTLTLKGTCPLTGNLLRARFAENMFFDGIQDSSGVRGFIQSGVHQYHVVLIETRAGYFEGEWSIFFLHEMDSRLLLSIENCEAENYAAYLILGDSRAPRLMCGGFQKNGDTLSFGDFRTGLMFRAVLDSTKILLTPLLVGQPVTTITLNRTTEALVPKAIPSANSAAINNGWRTADPASSGFNPEYFARLGDSVQIGSVTNTHSVLIASHGKLVYEQYFEGYDAGTVHDLRSAQKSLTSATIGVAIDRGLIKSVYTPIYELLPKELRDTEASDPRKSKITLENLLTMSSGIDAVDFGTDRESTASEDAYQQTENWPRTILEAPMLNEPGTHANYGSANACLAGTILDEAVKEPLQLFIDESLFRPLGITNYILQTDFAGSTYGAGGIFMTPRDMLKIGQLYLNGGTWNGQYVLSKSWIDESWHQHTTLDNSEKHEGYGYFWWQRTYTMNGKEVLSHEARGAGGQYIIVIPEYELVIAVTSGNFRNSRFWQPEKIVEEYILPAMTLK